MGTLHTTKRQHWQTVNKIYMYTYFYYGVDTYVQCKYDSWSIHSNYARQVSKRKIYIDSLFVTQLGSVYYKNTFTPFIMKVN